ncbi:MAG TPA: TrkA family potassium uptake protein [Chloroflexota bacterium]|jgi:trk system potassium uptake protein TrkA|nr:TrkA family potassium uptake protein [Chloroflexota bacterium]
MNVVILGCGRVGARLAAMLDKNGHRVSVIDRTLEAFDRLPNDFKGLVVLGQGVDQDILSQAGIEQADAFCTLSNDDNINIMASQVATAVFHVPRVITRIYDPRRQDTYTTLGLESICPTRVGVDRIEQLLGVE